jgi:hypothetical protein
MAKEIISFRNFMYLLPHCTFTGKLNFVEVPLPCSVLGSYQCFRGAPVLYSFMATGSSEMLVPTY